MSAENEDLSQSLAAELTGTTGMDDVGNDMPDSLAADLHDQETMFAERDIHVNDDVDDTREAAEQREVEQDQALQRGRKVPLAALHEERQKRQALEVQLAAYQQQMQQFQAQQQAAQQAQLQAQQEAEIPDPEIDPIGFIKAKELQFAQALEQLKGGQVQQSQVQQIEAQVLQEAAVLAPVITDAETRFEAANPDYPQAFDHVQRTVEANMRAQHPGINEQQLGMLRTAALVEFAKTCQAQGIDPAARIYESAQKLGFKTARQAPRREAPTSLANLSGSPRAPDEKGNITASDISSMSDAEFDKFWNIMKGGGSQGPAF